MRDVIRGSIFTAVAVMYIATMFLLLRGVYIQGIEKQREREIGRAWLACQAQYSDPGDRDECMWLRTYRGGREGGE